MIDFRACRLAGVLNIPKCRAIWHEGSLKVWRTKDRKPYFYTEITCSEPVRQSPIKRRWSAKTPEGERIMMIGECWACAGHWVLAKIPPNKLLRG